MRFYEGNTVADWDVDPNAVSCPYQDAPEVGKWGWKQDADGKWILVDNEIRQVRSPSYASVVATSSLTYNISYLYNDRNDHDKYVQAITSTQASLKTLLDSGALEENFISSEIVKKLNLKVYKMNVPVHVTSVHGI